MTGSNVSVDPLVEINEGGVAVVVAHLRSVIEKLAGKSGTTAGSVVEAVSDPDVSDPGAIKEIKAMIAREHVDRLDRAKR